MIFKEHCYVCGSDEGFEIQDDKILYREAKCCVCGAAIRNSDIAKVILYKMLKKNNSLKESLDEFKNFNILGTATTGIINEYFSKLPNYISGEYFENIPSGSFNENNIQCIDLQNLPFIDNHFDLIISEDVLEHVEDINKAFKEINRVLKIDAAHIFTIPFHEGRKTVRRHDKVKIFHGDPLRKEGAIVYYDFGEDLIEKLEYYGMKTEKILCHKYFEEDCITNSDKEYLNYIELQNDLLKFFRYNSDVFYSKKESIAENTDFTGERFIPIFEANQEIAIEHIQRYISIQELVSGKVVLDAACGEGYGTNIIANNANMVYGIDICKDAIQGAKKKYKKDNIEFDVCSIRKINLPDNSMDIVVSFETIEHVSETIQKEFLLEVKRVLKSDGIFIISTPNKKNYSDLFNYKNEYHIKEFYENEFVDFLNDYFSNIKLYNQSFETTSILSEMNPSNLTVIDNIADMESKYIIAVCSNVEIDNLESINSIIINKKGEYLESIKRIIDLQNKLEELSKWGEKINHEKDVYITRISELQLEVKEKESFIDNLNLKYQDEISTINEEKQNIYNMYRNVFEEATKYQNTLQDIYNSNMWKLASRYYRVRDKFKILKWFHNKLQKNKITRNQEKPNDISYEGNAKSENISAKIIFDKSVYQNYTKQDIIILSVIDWDFRFQRPQHIAENMARLGHRVFYFNANYNSNNMKISCEKENLYLVTLNNSYGKRIYDIDFNDNPKIYVNQINEIMHKYNIRDCSVMVQYPTWYPVAKYIKSSFGSKIVFDYIDDYTGFEETANYELIKTTEELLELSDIVIATSLFLYEKAKLYTDNVEIVRNGTEFEFFNQAKSATKSDSLKIGYYGAIAEWFDIEKIAYIAQRRPDIEIELIGNVSHKLCNELKKYKNIKFLGEKNYKDLPNYLKSYDVCLIPFRADIDLIKATNPVKFYEYLSAGKKVVATEIPELEPFRDNYVYLSNDNAEFLRYIEFCLDNKDDLATESEIINFAKTQDWGSRCIQLENIIKNNTPLVSIILVTYNNIDYTKKCINSILRKTAYPNYEIVIVDNLSVDGTQDYLQELEKEHDNVKIILNESNLGFAAGNNAGIKICNGEYIILLNNDTLVTRGWITSMIKHLDKNNIGMVGPVTNSIGNESQINITYKDINDMDEFALNYTTSHHDELYEKIQVLAMFCVAIKRSVIDEVGLLDENYKIGMFEDDDYSMALKSKGYEVACIEDVFIHHFGNVSFKKLEDKKYREIFEQNKSYFESKWNILWTPHKYRDGIEL